MNTERKVITKVVKVNMKFTKDKTPGYNLIKKIEKLRDKNVDKYGIFQCPINYKIKCNSKQVCNVTQLETYVCFDKTKIKDSDMFYYDYPCFAEGFVAAKLAISCKLKKNKVFLEPMFLEELSYLFEELDCTNNFFTNEIKFLMKIFKKDDYEKSSENILYKEKSFTILLDISKEFAMLFTKHSILYTEK